MSILSKDGYSYQTFVCPARGARLRSEASKYSLGVAPNKAKILVRNENPDNLVTLEAILAGNPRPPYHQSDLRPHHAAQSTCSRRIPGHPLDGRMKAWTGMKPPP